MSKLPSHSLKKVLEEYSNSNGNTEAFAEMSKRAQLLTSQLDIDVWHDKFNEVFQQLRPNFKDKAKQCYSPKTKQLYSLKYKKLPKEIRPLLELLHNHPNGPLDSIEKYRSMTKEFRQWKQLRPSSKGKRITKEDIEKEYKPIRRES
ncbi:MAG: hypothetical protein J6B63_06080, partial [Treponema sp.]|nr:hypothetical protein [Treponema sp.]